MPRTAMEPSAPPEKQGRIHVHLAQVRFADLDPLNHVNNVRMLTYLEDARMAFLQWDSAPAEGAPPVFGSLVVARHEVDYVKPLLLRRDPVRVETRVREVRRAGFRLACEIRDADALYVRAETVVVGYDLARQAARRLTGDERAYLEGHLGTDG